MGGRAMENGAKTRESNMKLILAALDGSPRSLGVLEAALAAAQKNGAKLALFRGVGVPPEMPSELLLGTSASLEDVLRKSAEEYLAGMVQGVPPELRAAEATLVGVGSPWEAVCHAAETRHVD